MAGIDYTTRSVPFNVIRNTGGLNTSSSGLNVQDSESTECQNIDFNKFGSILKRNGYATLNSSAFNSGATWTGLFWYEITSSGTNYLVGVCGNKIAKMDDLDGTWDDITGALTITAGNNNLISSANHLDTWLATNGVDAPFQWAGSGNAAAMTVPSGLTTARFVESWNRYTFLANVTVSATVHKTRIYYSAIDSISSWASDGFRDLGRNDGQPITGLKRLGDRLIIYKSRSIWYGQFTGDSDVPFIFFPTPSHVGAESGYSIQEVDNGHIFRSQDGYYYFDGVNSTKISDRVNVTLGEFNKSRSKYSVSCYQKEKNRYWAAESLDGVSTHARVLTWDSYNNAFGLYKGHTPNCFAIVYVNGEERVYFGDYAGFVYRADTGTNDNPAGVSTAIDAYYYTKWYNFDDLVDQKGISNIVVYYQIANSTLTFAYSYDFEDADQYTQSFSMNTSTAVYGTAIYGTDTYAASGGALSRRDITGRGRVIRIKVANSSLSQTMQVDGFGMLPHLETNAG